MEPSPGDATPKKHVRHSSGRATIVRRSTKGPLDVEDSPLMTSDPLSPTPSVFHTPQPSSQPQLLSPTSLTSTQSQFSPRLPSPRRTPRMPSPQPSNVSSNPSFKTAHSTLTPRVSGLAPAKDFSYLLRPEIYHPLTLLDVPPPFRLPTSQPEASTPLEELISSGHFRSAAITAAARLTSTNPSIDPSDHEQIFSLLYTRLSCLTLCNQTSFAAQEVKALEDLNSAYYRDSETQAHLVPWELRVLAVRLQGMGFNDARRGVMGYYDLARSARLYLTSLKKARTEASGEEKDLLERQIRLWTRRLSDLGIRVTSALIEMDDLEGASQHLRSLGSSEPTLEYQKALLWLYLGDVEAARTCISDQTGTNEKILGALSFIADSEPASSAPIWEELIASSDDATNIAMYRQNLAVCQLYLGQLSSARDVLEGLVEEGNTFHALTFNLSTIYELCTEGSRRLKIDLAEKVAGMMETGKSNGIGLGRERVNGDFKL